jgi:type II secretory pathway pseudopilin PulG
VTRAFFLAALVHYRRRSQAGTTLVEMLVSLTIIGLALVLVIGTFSTGLLDASLTKRNTAVEAALQYELEKVHSSTFSNSAAPYSECFATEDQRQPLTLAGYQDPCPDGPYTLRADVTWSAGSGSGQQVWTVAILAWPGGDPVGSPVSQLKVNR